MDYIYDYADEASARKYIPLLLAGGGLVFLVLSLDELLNNPMRN